MIFLHSGEHRRKNTLLVTKAGGALVASSFGGSWVEIHRVRGEENHPRFSGRNPILDRPSGVCFIPTVQGVVIGQPAVRDDS